MALVKLRARTKQPGQQYRLSMAVAKPENWVWWVNQPQTDGELEALRHSVNRGTPYGIADWFSAQRRNSVLKQACDREDVPETEAKSRMSPFPLRTIAGATVRQRA